MIVVKVGGSLLDWPSLSSWLSRFVEGRRDDRPVLIVGGGPAADFVRAYDVHHGLGEKRSHDLALRALDLTAHALAALLSGFMVVDRVEHLTSAWDEGLVPILAPRAVLEEDDRTSIDRLPHSWDVTSDSIAAHLAVRLGAEELVVLKSVAIPEGIDRVRAARLGLVDSWFPVASRGLRRVTWLNPRDPSSAARSL